MKYLYGFFLPITYPGYCNLPQNRKWALRDTAKEAKALVKEFGGGSIRRMPYPDGGAWDMTTFHMSSYPYPLPRLAETRRALVTNPNLVETASNGRLPRLAAGH